MAAPVLEQLNLNLLDDKLLFKNVEDWKAAQCYNKIFTHPIHGLTNRVSFINEIVDIANEKIKQHPLDLDHVKKIIFAKYLKALRLWCYDGSMDLGELNIIILGYINSLGTNPQYYPKNIKRIKNITEEDITTTFFEDVMKLLRTHAETGMARWRERIDETLPLDENYEKKYPHLYNPRQGPYPGFQDMLPFGGKIRSATKRRPHRKSSTMKRHPRRKSSAIKRHPRRTSRK